MSQRPPGTLCVPLLFLLVVLFGSACTTPRLVHLDGDPFIPQRPLVTLEGGWLAVDSCASGHHALVELELEAPKDKAGKTLVPIDPQRFGLLYGGRTLPRYAKPHQTEVVGPICWGGGQRWEQYVYKGEPVYDTGLPEEARCVYIIRAEFDLPTLPTSDDALALSYGIQAVLIRPPEHP